MADNKKIYTIQINGIQESTSAVEALNKQLNDLEQRIKALEKSNVKVNTSTSGGGSKSSSTSSLSEEEKLAKQIEQIDAKREAYSKKIYQNYLAAKDVLDDTVKDQKQIAASERLQAKNYTNTMAGMKQELADLKSVMQTTDLGDENFEKMSQRAGELTAKLKELEESYGQFGRNVGNYQSAFDGLDKVSVTINGVTQQFDNLKQATKALRDGMGALEANGKKDTKMYKEMERELERVSKAQLRLNSAMKDAKSSSKAMDDLLDTMQSFGSFGQITQGFSTFFGFDNSEMEKQIAKLVALQNMLQGIEKIRQQMNTGEGIGKIFAKGSKGVDQFVAKLAGADYRMGKIVGSTKSASIALNGLSTALKGIGGIAISGGILLLTELIGNLVEKFKKWFTGGIEAGDATKILTSNVNALDASTERLLKDNTEDYFKGQADAAKTASNQVEILTNKITHLLLDLKELQGINFKKFNEFSSIAAMGAKDVESARMRFLELAKTIEKLEKRGKDSVFGETLSGLFSGINGYKRQLKELGSVLLDDFLARVDEVSFKARQEVNKLGYVTKDTANEIASLKKELDENRATNGVLTVIERFCDNSERYSRAIESVKGALNALSESLPPADITKLEQYKIDAMPNSEAKIRRQNELNRKKEMESVKFNPAYTKAINAKYKTELDENLKAYRKSKKQEFDQKKKQDRDIQNEIDNNRLQLMREGLAKEMQALELERNQKLTEIVDSAIRVSERSELVNQVYDKKIKEWAYEMEQVYTDMWNDIYEINHENAQTNFELIEKEIDPTQLKRDVGYNMINSENYDDAKNLEAYYQEILNIERNAANEELEIAKKRLADEYEYNKKEEELRHNRLVDAKNGEYKKQLEAGKITLEQYNKLMEDENAAHYARMNILSKEYGINLNEATEKNLQKTQSLYNEYFTNIINDLQKEKDKIDEKFSEPVTNKFGMINFSMTRANYKAAVAQYENLKNDIIKKKTQLKQALKSKTISASDFTTRISDLKRQLRELNKASDEYKKKQKELTELQIQDIAQYVQQTLQSISDVLSAVWDAQDIGFDKQQEQIDKQNDALDKALDKQQEIIEQHKSAIDSIEDELANSRGSRRQHLIDMLNAEMEAQRQAQKEEQRIEKEKEALQKKQEALDLKRKKAEYKRNIAQIILNGAMAISYAAVNHYPLPAIPMIALATTTTAAQLAIALSNKPYAKGGQLDGGVAQGARHKDGGIPVLGGRASIEGGEFITNRTTTAKNIDLLEYINSKKKRLDMSDLIDFYSTAPKKTIRTVRTKFEDGGYMPTLPNALDVRDQLQNIVINQDNRPIYVSVVDINNKQEDVRRVQTLAGL